MGFASLLNRLKGYAQDRAHENRSGLTAFINGELNKGVNNGFDKIVGKKGAGVRKPKSKSKTKPKKK